MNKLNPIEAVVGCAFDLNITVTGLESTYTKAHMYIDDALVASLCNKPITNGSIKFSVDGFPSTYAVGPHTYSVTVTTTTIGTTGTDTTPKKVVIYKNSLNVLDDPTKTTT